jgi:FkbM family methyltransferase
MQSTTLTLVDGVQLVVPDSLHLLTPYVLREQRDWFEDELRFMRRALQPGDKTIDVGASFGVYAMTMARLVGPTGQVWAFEPSSESVALLRQSITANGVANVAVEECALSSTVGTARFVLNRHTELSMLVRDAGQAGESTVRTLTLDERLQHHAWRDVAYLKLDAEGEEENILKGATIFLEHLSPLIQYEVKAQSHQHDTLVRHFAGRRYGAYRLVPGLQILVPFEDGERPDPYLLNLFACKPDRAAKLRARGLLVDAGAKPGGAVARAADTHNWRTALMSLPYVAELAGPWEMFSRQHDVQALEDALALYAFASDGRQAIADRWAALRESFGQLQSLSARDPSRLHLASFARVATDYGARSPAADALIQLWKQIKVAKELDLGEPFLPPCARFDQLAPGAVPANWATGAILEALERVAAHSSFYTALTARPRLELIEQLGFADEDMLRRLRLLRERFPIEMAAPAP